MGQRLNISKDTLADYHRFMIVLFGITMSIIFVVCGFIIVKNYDNRVMICLMLSLVLIIVYILFVLMFYPHPYKLDKKMEQMNLSNSINQLNQTYFAKSLCYAEHVVFYRQQKILMKSFEDIHGILVVRMKPKGLKKEPWYKMEFYTDEGLWTYRVYNSFSNQQLAIFLDAILTDYPTMKIAYNWLNYEKYIKTKEQLIEQ